MEDWQAGGFGLYIHWPFCQAKCPYCDFNSHVSAQIDQTRWQAAYLSEIRRVGALTQGRVLNTVFFGGGTPSLMQPDVVAAVIAAIRDTWTPANDLEITLEANPTSSDAGRFAGFADAGVNRLSMGIQSLRDADLKRLGRLHSASEARAAFDVARGIFDRVSFDLIYARQYQTLDDWRAELREAAAMAVDHLSLYQLTVEDGTAFGSRFLAGKLGGLPVDDLAADMYTDTQDTCDALGLHPYEVSNHARPGAESRHNLIYWRYGDYAGIGPGAHGRLTLNGGRMATETPLAPGKWLEMVERGGDGTSVSEVLTPNAQATEYLLMSLRLREGSSLSRYAALNGVGLPVSRLNGLSDMGLIRVQDDCLSVTDAGRILLNSVLSELLG
ncbi:radical SAM family heme chaperone HemW [Roseicitreum antarcticum]|uniref:Heme chaperone HemW n=1 Tax=Roseicitreum antarcticum TaxID=564137 RepID=A0A1H2QWE4_9RHOB|nr:radical SAM family heme chaperone HemW [Roseicitreum antarcticum]SDW11473.1 oxygen-independent coproporphyrinogen-3 oxidase [Roseicitreum antarcticum]